MTTLAFEFLSTPCLSYPSDRRIPEWPPSPDRVYQTLVATACELNMDVQPLLELEETTPSLSFPEGESIMSASVFVPSNQTREQPNAAITRPYVKTADGARLYYTYSGLSEATRQWLQELAPKITHLGRAESAVVAAVVDDNQAPSPQWEPHHAGEYMLSSPYAGRLRDLDSAFNAGERCQAAPMAKFRRARKTHPSSYWRELIVLRPDRRLHIVRVVDVAQALRQALLSVCGDTAPVWVHGHGRDNHHIAITPLPHVGYRHSDGMMTGIGVWIPETVTRKERAEIAFKLAGIHTVQVGGLHFKVSVAKSEHESTRAATWTKCSRIWESVTPVVLDKYPKKGKLTAESIIVASCAHAGLPAPQRVQLIRQPNIQSVPMAHEFKTRTRKAVVHHTRIEFDQTVWGPVLLGRDRFYGMGMFRPVG
jgi:CRISPR-associated protein Csb2